MRTETSAQYNESSEHDVWKSLPADATAKIDYIFSKPVFLQQTPEVITNGSRSSTNLIRTAFSMDYFVLIHISYRIVEITSKFHCSELS